MEYVAIITSILYTADGIVLLTVLSGYQVCTVQSIGIFSCGIRKYKSSDNHIFGILGKNVGDQLPPIAMVL